MKKEKIIRKMFTDNLPKWGKQGKGNEGTINWNESIGYTVKFVYGDIEGEVEIIKLIKENNVKKLVIRYKGKEKKIGISNFNNCGIGDLIGIKSSEYKYNVGDLVKTKSGYVKILKCFRLPRESDKNKIEKAYEYKCLNDGYTNIIEEYCLVSGIGCPVCVNRITIKGINDIATTHPHLVKYFVNIEDTYIHSYGYDGNVLLKCPDCGFEKEQCMNNLTSYHKNGFVCPNCGDGFSYPEKFFNNVLKQLNIIFKTHYTFEWSKNIKHKNKRLNGNKIYDFYFEVNNEKYIVETHGEQHYIKDFSTHFQGRTLDEEQENDRLKKELALNNGIKEENYIIIDCRRAEFKWVKDNIINKIAKLFDLSSIDWIECGKYASSSLIKTASELWEQGIKSSIKISEIIKVDRHTVERYLKQGTILGFCNYRTKYEIKEENILKICELWEIYNGDTFKIEQNSKFERPTILRYLREASKLGLCNYNSEEEKIKSIELMAKSHEKQVICLETNQIFSSAKEIEEKSLELFKVKLLACVIRDVCTGGYMYKQYKGYTFKYVN